MRPNDDETREIPDDATTERRRRDLTFVSPLFSEHRFFDAGKNGDGIPEAEAEEEEGEVDEGEEHDS